MSNLTRMTNYKDLLKIRQHGRKRISYFVGAIFLVSLLAMFGFGLTNNLSERELYIAIPVNILLGVSYVVARMRLEITSEAIEMIDNIES